MSKEILEAEDVRQDRVAFRRAELLEKLAQVYHLLKEPHFSSTPTNIQSIIDSMRDLIERIRDIQRQAGWHEACRQCREPCCAAKISNLTSFHDLVLLQLLQRETDLSEAAFANRTRIGDCLWLGPNGCALDTHQIACATYICPDPAFPVAPLTDETRILRNRLWDYYREISPYINEGIDKSDFPLKK